MQTASGSLYKDCTTQDFDHYFRGTGMVLKLPTDKKRLYVVEGISGNGSITGSYLTREQVWKEKVISFRGWWDHLDVVLPRALHFNVGNAAATWVPSLARNLKKSFPYLTNYVRLFGVPTPEEASEQFVSAVAFGDFYSTPKLPDGEYALKSDRSATAVEGEFIMDMHTRKLHFKNTLVIGKIVRDKRNETVHLDHNRLIFKDLLINEAGLRSDRIIILDPPKVEAKVLDPIPAPNAAMFNAQTQAHFNAQMAQAQAANFNANNWAGAGLQGQQFVNLGGGNDQLHINNTWGTVANTQTTVDAPAPPENFTQEWGNMANRMTAGLYNDAAGTPMAMRRTVYDQGAVPWTMWVPPGWGRGWASIDVGGLVYTSPGRPPSWLPAGRRPYKKWGQ